MVNHLKLQFNDTIWFKLDIGYLIIEYDEYSHLTYLSDTRLTELTDKIISIVKLDIENITEFIFY